MSNTINNLTSHKKQPGALAQIEISENKEVPTLQLKKTARRDYGLHSVFGRRSLKELCIYHITYYLCHYKTISKENLEEFIPVPFRDFINIYEDIKSYLTLHAVATQLINSADQDFFNKKENITQLNNDIYESYDRVLKDSIELPISYVREKNQIFYVQPFLHDKKSISKRVEFLKKVQVGDYKGLPKPVEYLIKEKQGIYKYDKKTILLACFCFLKLKETAENFLTLNYTRELDEALEWLLVDFRGFRPHLAYGTASILKGSISEAIKTEDTFIIQQLLLAYIKHYSWVENSGLKLSEHPLFYAIFGAKYFQRNIDKKGFLEVAEKILLDKNGTKKINSPCSKGFSDLGPIIIKGTTPVTQAAKNGYLSLIKLLVEKGASIINKSEWDSALILAVDNNHPTVVEYLSTFPSLINSKGYAKKTPLMLAVEQGYYDCVKAILKNKNESKLNIKDSNFYKYTPLLVAALSGYSKIVDLLLWNKAQLMTDAENKTKDLHTLCKGEQTDIIELLKLEEIDPNISNGYQETALDVATRNENTKVVKFLIKSGAIVKNYQKELYNKIIELLEKTDRAFLEELRNKKS